MKQTFDKKLFFITLFLGWFGIDKLYVGKGKAWKFFLVKFAYLFVLVGIVWNIYDLVKITKTNTNSMPEIICFNNLLKIARHLYIIVAFGNLF